MKKIFAILMLVVHMNGSMFMPQVAETDVFDSDGQQVDDINSLYEFIDQVVLGHPDSTPEDEDDDSGQNFHVSPVIDMYCDQVPVLIEHQYLPYKVNGQYVDFSTPVPSATFTEIITPPPENLA